MSIEVNWHSEKKRIIVFSIVRKWKWQEMFDAIEECHAMMDTVNHSVRTVFDVSHTMGWPPNPLENMQKACAYYHPRSSTVTIVGVGRLLQSIVDLFQRLYRFTNSKGVYFFKTRAEAVTFLQEQIAEESLVTSN